MVRGVFPPPPPPPFLRIFNRFCLAVVGRFLAGQPPAEFVMLLLLLLVLEELEEAPVLSADVDTAGVVGTVLDFCAIFADNDFGRVLVRVEAWAAVQRPDGAVDTPPPDCGSGVRERE